MAHECCAHNHASNGYAGDVSPKDAYNFVRTQNGILVDVRTPSEWLAGKPDLSERFETLSWKTEPAYALNPNFAQELAQTVSDKETPLFFLCRSGGRSTDAAIAMTQLGYANCFNVAGGFEGQGGWKETQLPWKQG